MNKVVLYVGLWVQMIGIVALGAIVGIYVRAGLLSSCLWLSGAFLALCWSYRKSSSGGSSHLLLISLLSVMGFLVCWLAPLGASVRS